MRYEPFHWQAGELDSQSDKARLDPTYTAVVEVRRPNSQPPAERFRYIDSLRAVLRRSTAQIERRAGDPTLKVDFVLALYDKAAASAAAPQTLHIEGHVGHVLDEIAQWLRQEERTNDFRDLA